MEKNWSLRASSPVSNIWADLALVARARCKKGWFKVVFAREKSRARRAGECAISQSRASYSHPRRAVAMQASK